MSRAGPAARDRAGWLRRDAERISGSLPPLLVEAQRLAASLVTGVHGRRRAGIGETFWQYRAAHPGDPYGAIDWRRSARSDRLYVREMEWEAAETVMVWCDRSHSMDFRSDFAPRAKAERAALLTLALGVLLHRGGERYGLMGTEAELPRTGERQLVRWAGILSAEPESRPDFGAPPAIMTPRVGRAVLMSDFMGPREVVFPALMAAAGQGISGIYLQILDPVEEEFPFAGRTRFESVGREVRHETDQATALRARYLDRLAERRDELRRAARRTGWQLVMHRTDQSPRLALLQLYTILGGS
ncbi:MAG TPA: DUF58 domain-containing protein [Thermohalobaculum sp.]|nr:DUF58 domain-containing protein [Thermohalobaculum sp.]